jgi:glycine dehydrogenase
MKPNELGLPYNPETLPRELKPFYISIDEEQEKQMLQTLNLRELKEVFLSLPPEVMFSESLQLPAPLSYKELVDTLKAKSEKNNIRPSFIGDALPDYKVQDIVPYVCGIRGLTTAYTPYQPERSQGTLNSLWIYSSCLSMLTGYEGINASMYERSTCLFEALNTALRLKKTNE